MVLHILIIWLVFWNSISRNFENIIENSVQILPMSVAIEAIVCIVAILISLLNLIDIVLMRYRKSDNPS